MKGRFGQLFMLIVAFISELLPSLSPTHVVLFKKQNHPFVALIDNFLVEQTKMFFCSVFYYEPSKIKKLLLFYF